MSETFYDNELIERQSVKTAVLLAKNAYEERYAGFVKDRPERLAYIDEKIVALAHEFAYQVDADPERVTESLKQILSDFPFAKDKDEKEDKDEEKSESPAEEKKEEDKEDHKAPPFGKKKDDDDKDDDDDKKSRVAHAYTEIGDAADPATWQSCFRCEDPLNPVQAATSPVCPICTDMIINNKTARKALEVVALDDGRVLETIPLQSDDESHIERVTLGLLTNMDRDHFFVREVELPDLIPDMGAEEPPPPPDGAPPEGGGIDPVEPVSPVDGGGAEPQQGPPNLSAVLAAMPMNPTQECKCDYCPFVGTLPVVQLHEQQLHSNELRAQQQGDKAQMNSWDGVSPMAPQQMSYGATIDKEILREPGHQTDPSDAFEDRVQMMANNQAAAAWSLPSKSDIQQIADKLGLDPNDVHKNLIVVATFGDAIAVNGSQGSPQPDTEALTQLSSFGGQVPTSEEEVDVPTAIQATAHELGLQDSDIELSVRDSYGGDLGQKYFVSVSGTAAYFLPKEMAGDQSSDQVAPTGAPQTPPQVSTDPPEPVGAGPQKLQARVVATFSNLEDALIWERAKSA